MSESDANRDLADTARMRGLATLQRDPLEDTQPMPVADRRMRQWDAKALRIMSQADEARERRKPATVGLRKPAFRCAFHLREHDGTCPECEPVQQQRVDDINGQVQP
jgi:hypothetical protein